MGNDSAASHRAGGKKLRHLSPTPSPPQEQGSSGLASLILGVPHGPAAKPCRHFQLLSKPFPEQQGTENTWVLPIARLQWLYKYCRSQTREMPGAPPEQPGYNTTERASGRADPAQRALQSKNPQAVRPHTPHAALARCQGGAARGTPPEQALRIKHQRYQCGCWTDAASLCAAGATPRHIRHKHQECPTGGREGQTHSCSLPTCKTTQPRREQPCIL